MTDPQRQKADPQRQDMLEIYKLHAELTDRVSQRREGANRLYVSLVVGLAALLAAVSRLGIGDAPLSAIMGFVGLVGAVVSASWIRVIRYYSKLEATKHGLLREIEETLPYWFFRRESARLSDDTKYRWLIHAEMAVPLFFLLLSFVLFASALFHTPA
ncbi:MAG: hypothetical protein OXG35_13975 [Acidobacteria bacterium]|nr:hypothetical protein [Acidobacteriota bacterium]